MVTLPFLEAQFASHYAETVQLHTSPEIAIAGRTTDIPKVTYITWRL